MGNPYPVAIQDERGIVHSQGLANFTDASNRPGGGGSQPLRRVVFPVTFETVGFDGSSGPGLLVTNLAPGETLLAAGVRAGGVAATFISPMFCATTPWTTDGDAPYIFLGAWIPGGTPNPPAGTNATSILQIAASEVYEQFGGNDDPVYALGDGSGKNIYNQTDADYPLIAYANEADGSDPQLTSGEGFFDLLILTAP